MPLIDRLSITGRVLITQLKQFLWPYDLSFVYAWEPLSWTAAPEFQADRYVHIAIAGVTLVVANFVTRRKALEPLLLAAFTVWLLIISLPRTYIQLEQWRNTERGDFSAANYCLDHVRRLNPPHPEARYSLAKAYSDTGRWADSNEVLTQLIHDGFKNPWIERLYIENLTHLHVGSDAQAKPAR